MIRNPILPGFNPDPSIIRVGEDYYIATSTFEWFPGVQIHHSRDLQKWQLINRPLNRLSQLDMRGNPDSGGVWAPCLSYDQGIHYLVYSDVKTVKGLWKDVHNYLVYSDDIKGEWSEPIYLNSSGFDPSLFHDDERKWLVNMQWDHRPGNHRFGGIVLQEYSLQEQKLIGKARNIFKGTELQITEGPHLYKINDYYYLITAEGGTGYGHAVTVARSRDINGPYEVHPDNPLLTSAGDEELDLQKAGHADLVETPTGEWYLVYLCSRVIKPQNRCPLGRETAIQKIYWKEGWPYLYQGGSKPALLVPGPAIEKEEPGGNEGEESDGKTTENKMQKRTNNNDDNNHVIYRDNFNSERLDINFQSLRIPLTEEYLSLTERPGYLRLKGHESLSSLHRQALIARRQQAFQYMVTTAVEFDPENYQQMAGLVCYYNTRLFYYLRISYDEKTGKNLAIISCDNGECLYPARTEVRISGWPVVYLRVKVYDDQLQFYYSKDQENWQELDPVLDASKLSDDYARGFAFTGAFVGLCCQDLSGQHLPADFGFFEYAESFD